MSEQIVSIRINESKINCKGFLRFKKEKNGHYSWHIPGYDMYFSSSTREDGHKIARAMIKSFFIFWLEKEKNFNQMILEITKLGFKSIDHRNTVNKMLQGRKHKANFTTTPSGANISDDMEVEELELEVA